MFLKRYRGRTEEGLGSAIKFKELRQWFFLCNFVQNPKMSLKLTCDVTFRILQKKTINGGSESSGFFTNNHLSSDF